ncbi:spore morphogenesis/germination protein YwcE [Halalkalibacterium halodurans]|uniref:Spore morphogenesis and germination protein YwcE n=2 Tax=Halalkalibacterium halodurans TaxID=86665 RepID=YWCE_HALH5|nr:spore morphogenesis/germination protein YwcE [Halalkalibacterium halodurans]Q9KB63.1 RecName: Full=Spore morphogenesis and germination protein YwcE [Halalkalibacterium halodurans C-125]MDY7222621.1 spore morphogenesis/germination protein YwcE [Halalkalibacterium halodurans]MDY7241842.1 spore morphogenesis/germination protein YwcE [Halalkalibacterium halodurans]MED3647049.1 spore morphogenesis/germination protein YwcE [Halalkalibacterium halodurans]MED4080795.1 spore morphogenesis/germinatio
MDLFFAYMLVASATPLFLWLEHRKIALTSIPFIIIMWVLALSHMFEGFLFDLHHSVFLTAFFVNVIIAHFAALVLYAYPHIRPKSRTFTESMD